ncbi:MAG: hypothetical protein JW785_00370 [Acidimicrobiia bacterium]|nr:hypothetical protein [Acidimicrobiia bacterium]
MLITEHFVFVHIPKTGGDFIRRVCLKHLPPDSVVAHHIAKHGRDTEIPGPYRGLPRFALVRNPWDWHVSWFHYLMGSGRPEEHRDRVRVMNPWFVTLSDGFRADFGTTMRRLYDPAVAASFSPQSVVRAAAEQEVDLLTLHLRRQTGASEAEGRLTMGRFEDLRRDFHHFLAAHNVEIPEGFRRDLYERPPINRSRRSRFQDYYDPELRGIIGRFAAGTIARYGYSFEDDGAAAHDADPATGAGGRGGGRRLS